MVAPGIKESLIDSAAYKMVLYELLDAHLMGAEHVVETVSIVFEPELTVSLYSDSRITTIARTGVGQRVRIRTVKDYLLLIRNATSARFESSDEPVTPVIKAPMRFFTI